MVTVCLSSTGVLYSVIEGLTNSVTGTYFLSLLVIVLVLMAIVMALRLPVEVSAILVLPLFLALLACDGDWLSIGGVILIYLGIILGKNFFFRT